MQKTIDEVLAEAAIRDLQRRYCRGVDRLDWHMVRSVFHDDAEPTMDFLPVAQMNSSPWPGSAC